MAIADALESEAIRTLFVDDHKVLRQGLVQIMAGQPNIRVVGEAANGIEAIEKVRQLRPHVIVMDINMPRMDGMEAARRIKAEWPEMHIIGLSMSDDEQVARRMREAGADAFVSKGTSTAELLKTIYSVIHQ